MSKVTDIVENKSIYHLLSLHALHGSTTPEEKTHVAVDRTGNTSGNNLIFKSKELSINQLEHETPFGCVQYVSSTKWTCNPKWKQKHEEEMDKSW